MRQSLAFAITEDVSTAARPGARQNRSVTSLIEITLPRPDSPLAVVPSSSAAGQVNAGRPIHAG